MAKNDIKIEGSDLMKQQPPRSKGADIHVDNMPGKMKGDKMPHESFHDKMAKKLGC